MIFIFVSPIKANGAIKQNRTADLFLTKEVLYLLSYNGLVCLKKETVLYYISELTASGKMKEIISS